QVQKQIRERIERVSGDVDSQTIDIITDQVKEAITAGESVDKIRKRIRGVYDTATSTRSERIARTETIYQSNYAQHEAMRQLPSVSGQEWMANFDACEFCRALNGKVVGLGENFVGINTPIDGEDGGMYVADYEDV